MKRILKHAWMRWKEMAVYVGDFQARLLLTLFYLFVAAPFGLIARMLDPLRLRNTARPSGWVARAHDSPDDLSAARRQF
jgi:hypothetical protein